MKRILFLILALTLCISCFALSVGAASDKVFLDYNDYLESVVVSDGYDNVKFTLPLSFFSTSIYDITDGYYPVWKGGVSLSAYLTAGKSYRITFYFPYLKIANIPDGTTINANLYISRDGVRAYPAGSLNAGASYFKKDGSFIIQKNNDVGNYSPAGDLVFDISVASVPEAYGMQAFYQFNNVSVSTSGTYTFTLTDCFFLASISSLYRQQAMFGETNELIDEVNKQLEENGQKLDDIINGSVTPEAPNGSDTLDDFMDAENELLDQTQDGFDQAVNIFNQAPGIIALYGSAFFFVSSVIEIIATAGWIQGIVIISISLGLIAFIINMTATALNRLSKGGGKT